MFGTISKVVLRFLDFFRYMNYITQNYFRIFLSSLFHYCCCWQRIIPFPITTGWGETEVFMEVSSRCLAIVQHRHPPARGLLSFISLLSAFLLTGIKRNQASGSRKAPPNVASSCNEMRQCFCEVSRLYFSHHGIGVRSPTAMALGTAKKNWVLAGACQRHGTPHVADLFF